MLLLTTELASFDRKPVKPASAPELLGVVSGMDFLNALRNSCLTWLSLLALRECPARELKGESGVGK